MTKPTTLLLAASCFVVPLLAKAMDAEEQEALTIRMCERVIDEYGDDRALKMPSRDFQILEAELHRCEELIDGYLLDTR